ncbi:hypothetical protein [Acidisoma sp. 7E03]
MSFLTLLGLLFVGLKLAHIIAWSWLLVLAPFWAIPVLLVAMIVSAGTGLGAALLIGTRNEKRRGLKPTRR